MQRISLLQVLASMPVEQHHLAQLPPLRLVLLRNINFDKAYHRIASSLLDEHFLSATETPHT